MAIKKRELNSHVSSPRVDYPLVTQLAIVPF